MGGAASIINKFSGKGSGPATMLVKVSAIKTAEALMENHEARIKLEETLKLINLTERNRWDKICNVLNIEKQATERDPHPIKIEITVPEVKKAVSMMYENVSTVISDGIVMMREHFPQLYKKHTYARGKELSQIEREEKKLMDDSWAYGELEYEIFATIYQKITKSYGSIAEGVFYDLGCGAGMLVYAAAFIGDFSVCCGIEGLTKLLERGEAKTNKWNQIKKQFPPEFVNKTAVRWRNDDILTTSDWADGTFYLIHWSSFTKPQRENISEKLSKCKDGTIVITFTQPLPDTYFEVLVEDICRVSWGETSFFVHLRRS
jgi:SAM-dependent methyltransferase